MPERKAALEHTFFDKTDEKDDDAETSLLFVKWALPVLTVVILMFVPILLIFANQLDSTATKLDNLTRFTLASRESRINFQAEQTFLLCSRGTDLVRAEAQSDVDRVCAGYLTLNEAYITEREKQESAGSGE